MSSSGCTGAEKGRSEVTDTEYVSFGELAKYSKIQGKRDYELNCVWQRGHGCNRSNKFVDVTKANVRKVDISNSATFDENAYWEEARITDEIDDMNDRNREIDEMIDFYERLEKKGEQKKRHAQIAKELEELSKRLTNSFD